MDQRRKKNLYLGTLIVALHLLAIICGKINKIPMYGTTYSTFLSLVRSFIYIALFTAWGFSVRYRVIAIHTKRYLIAEAMLMVLWMLIRAVKYVFVVDPNVNRWLWYMYYIPMLLIPLVAILASLSLGKYGSYEVPRWIFCLGIATVFLILLVMTNDFHQLVFSFPEDTVVFTDSDYRYEIAYYGTFVCEGICILLAFGIMLYRCHLPKNRTIMWLPLLPISVVVIYTLLYVTNSTFVKEYAPDLTVSICCLIIATYESCIGNGLIQVNVHYRELFENAEFPVCITNQNYELYMASKTGEELGKKAKQYREQTVFMSDEGTRIKSFSITGGLVFWEENISTIRKEIDTLQDLQESLKESHMITVEEYRTNKEKARLEEINQIYDRMQMQTAGCLEKIQRLLEELSQEKEGEKERMLIGKIAVYGAYFKRRNNLLFVAETQKKIPGEELGSCFKESFAALEYLGIKASYKVEEQLEFSLNDLVGLYDLVQNVIEQTLDDLSAITAIVQKEGNSGIMYLSLSGKMQYPAFLKGVHVEKEDEGEYLLTCRLEDDTERGGMDGIFS